MTTSPPSRRGRRARSGPRASVYLAALVSRLTRTCSSRVGSASSRSGPARSATLELGACAPRSSGRTASTAPADDRRRGRCGSLRSWILPRVIRETSSRSSTSRARCLTCRSMTSRAHSRSLLRLRPAERAATALLIGGQRVAQLVGEHGQELVLAAVGLPRSSSLVGLGAVGDRRGRPGRRPRCCPRSSRIGAALSCDRPLGPVAGDQERVVGQADDGAVAEHPGDRILDRLASLLVDDPEDLAPAAARAASSGSQPVRRSATGLMKVTRPSASVAMTASPMLVSTADSQRSARLGPPPGGVQGLDQQADQHPARHEQDDADDPPRPEGDAVRGHGGPPR